MKVAVIWSSPNRDGLTASAKDRIEKGLTAKGAEIIDIHLNKVNLESCRACGNGWGTCRSNGECLIKDGFKEVYDKLVEADGIVFVSAVYWSNMTECMKILIDRLRRCEATHNHHLNEKRVLLAACAGGTGRGTLECLQQMEMAMVHMGMRAYDRIPVIRYNSDYILPALEKAGEIYAERLETGFDMYY